ncbi:MAG: DSD1 family PLP-dependent enzyme [Acetobacteraceae bacterium]
MTPALDDPIGCPVAEIDTPALLIDRAAMQRNIDAMARFTRAAGLNLRPHAKAHKCPEIARLQLTAGAIGLCCQKLDEAEALIDAGIDNVLIANEIMGRGKLPRLAGLARRGRMIVAIDNIDAAHALSDCLVAAGAQIGAVVDLDLGQRRCGVPPGAPALELGRRIAVLPGFALKGLQGYQGKLQHIPGYANRARAADAAHAALAETRQMFAASGLPVEIVTGAGTGTYDTDGVRSAMTEIQPGSYIFMDRQYRAIGGRAGDIFEDFEPALSVLATVMSTPTTDRVIVDAGLKALPTDGGLPALLDHPGWNYNPAGDEHGALLRAGGGPAPRLGEVVRLLPGHCDTTVNLYDAFHVIEDGRLAAIWPIPGRGCGR